MKVEISSKFITLLDVCHLERSISFFFKVKCRSGGLNEKLTAKIDFNILTKGCQLNGQHDSITLSYSFRNNKISKQEAHHRPHPSPEQQ